MVLLIDADNTQITKIENVIQELSIHGRIVVKRAYGNWSKDSLKNWEDTLKKYAIKAVQQFDYVSKKNASDIALVIEAMELLYEKIYDAFVIVSSDSDFTPLVIKLRESTVYVIGVGEKKTPKPFKNSCDEFILLENLTINSTASDNQNDNTDKTDEREEDIHKLFKAAWDAYKQDDGFVDVSKAGSYIKRTKSDADPRSFNHKKWTDFLKAYPDRYEIKKNKVKGGVSIYYKCKE